MVPRWTSLMVAVVAVGCETASPSSGSIEGSSTTSNPSTTGTTRVGTRDSSRPSAPTTTQTYAPTSGTTYVSSASRESCRSSAPPPPRDGCGSSATAGAPCGNVGSGGTCEAASYSFDRCDGGEEVVPYLACAASGTSSTTGQTTFLGFPDASGGDGGEWFPCGSESCDRFTSFCLYQFDSSDGPWCLPVPAACVSNVTCACIESSRTDAGEPYDGDGCSDTHGQISISTS